ncbi:YggT family protein [Curvibacter sp. CHRR-16]|uniref:YggT family protein n=1 Tax=Curvibacter sp. CHRR-16 TaxID=2835872 RepID=UPI001BDA61B2|nr:YggT family protein [Curvibacter sp. CHRR-16]MBT0571643.1 YggT family protein [Curvibacter sp. CHRR-16]
MLYSIANLLLEVVIGLFTSLCLLRWYMQWQHIPLSVRSGNPLAGLIFALTNWIVLPLRRVIPAVGRSDMASLLAAFLAQLVEYAVLWLLQGLQAHAVSLPWLALMGLLRLALTGLVVLTLMHAVLSWVPTQSPWTDVLQRLVAPLLAPIRRVLPLMGGVDLSPLALLVLLQIALLVQQYLQAEVLMRLA